MTLGETMYVRRLGAYSGVMVYALYPSLSTLEGLRGLGWRSWLEGLAKWFAKAILSSSSLYRMVTSSMPFPLPRVRSGEEGKKERSSLWARTLDDLVICRARAYYSIRERAEGVLRKTPHIELRTSNESKNVDKSLFLETLKEELSKSLLMSIREPLLKLKIGNILLRGRPDLYLIVSMKGIFRGFITELHETSFRVIRRTWHIIPRLYTYCLASHQNYGVVPIALSIPLSMEDEFGILCLLNSVNDKDVRHIPLRTMSSLYSELNYISTLERPMYPHAKSRIFCKECKYRDLCEFY